MLFVGMERIRKEEGRGKRSVGSRVRKEGTKKGEGSW
jgi:hypothetical protein